MSYNDIMHLRESVFNKYYSHLNPMQIKAVLNIEGPVLILAGAGSGKTTVLVNRISHMLNFGSIKENRNCTDEEINFAKEYENSQEKNMKTNLKNFLVGEKIYPSQILAITFTNKAAKEMKDRVEKLIGTQSEGMWISTFHSCCVKILRKDIERLGYTKSFVIYDRTDQISLIKTCLKELNISDKILEPNLVIHHISQSKNALMDPETFEKENQADFKLEKIAKVYTLYQKKLQANNALDFDDLLMKTVELLNQNQDLLEYYQKKFKYIMVDEYQDTNKIQYTLVHLLCNKHKNICVVGDDDQSIYGWRGADIRNILDFEKDYNNATIIKLEQNYRSTQMILDSANAVISKNLERKSKKLWTQNQGGEKIQVFKGFDEREEGDFIARKILEVKELKDKKNSDFAILYRTNAQSRAIEDALLKQNIPYKVYGGQKFYDRKEIKDILAYLRLIQNPLDNISLKRIINVPKRGIGNKTIDTIEEISKEKEESMYSVLLDIEDSSDFSSRAKGNINTFVTMMATMMAMKEVMPVTKLIEKVMENSGYLNSLQEENTLESQSRIENLKEFLTVANEFEQISEDKDLESFLASISLVTDIDSMDEELDFVSLMTMHSSKGLEFPVVFVSGVEEGMFPSAKSSFDETKLEEERRLCYVAITRAKEELFLTHVMERNIYGRKNFYSKSRFLDEIPTEFINSLNEKIQKQYHDKSSSGSKLGLGTYNKGSKKPIDNSEVELGSKISHPTFGIGTIITKDGNNVSIAFQNKGIKVINMNYVKLQVIE